MFEGLKKLGKELKEKDSILNENASETIVRIQRETEDKAAAAKELLRQTADNAVKKANTLISKEP